MDKSEIVQHCIKRATEYMNLIPQATEAEKPRLFEMAEH
jgi:hypothetical protein